jgi:hypothetical protein
VFDSESRPTRATVFERMKYPKSNSYQMVPKLDSVVLMSEEWLRMCGRPLKVRKKIVVL